RPPMTEHLQRKCRALAIPDDAVRFVGRVERATLPEVYRSAAICVIPSLYENLPYPCLEPLASGCAVLASEAGGIPEIVTTEVDGLLVPPGNASALAAALGRLFADSA